MWFAPHFNGIGQGERGCVLTNELSKRCRTILSGKRDITLRGVHDVPTSKNEEPKVTARCTEHLPVPTTVATFRSWRGLQSGIIRDLAITLGSCRGSTKETSRAPTKDLCHKTSESSTKNQHDPLILYRLLIKLGGPANPTTIGLREQGIYA